MKFEKDELIENIKRLNKEKRLKEGKEIQRVLSPADADAFEQHEEALEANNKRLDPKNYDKDIKDLIKDTASEESRYRHFDIVDRKELAKKINEAKSKGLNFKISRSVKEGYRYDFKVLDEAYVKKDCGDPEINKDAFNKATDINASSPSTGLAEDIQTDDTVDLLVDLSSRPELPEAIKQLDDRYFYILHDAFESASSTRPYEDLDLEESLSKNTLNEDLEEELKIYTSNLENFHPSKKAEDLWDEIKDSKKVEDLEYALETLYPDGISDEALDDMLTYEEDWIRDLIGLSVEDEEEIEEESINELEDDDEQEPVESDDAVDNDVEPIDYEESEDLEEPKEYDDVVELTDKDTEDDEPEGEKELGESVQHQSGNLAQDVDKDLEEDTDNGLNDLAEGFIKSQFKSNDKSDCNIPDDIEVKETVKISEDDDEIVNIDDSIIENMLGMPKQEENN